MPKAHKFTNGWNFTELTSCDVSSEEQFSTFKAALAEGVSKALEIEYHLHCFGDPSLWKR